MKPVRRAYTVWGCPGVCIVKAFNRKNARQRARRQGLKGAILSISLTGEQFQYLAR